jgi:hypothetical protein
MRVAIRLPFRTVLRAVRLRQGETPDTVDPATHARAYAAGWAVEAAASKLPWTSSCLVRALAAASLLRHRHINATLYLGVAREAGDSGAMRAHAWLRCGDLVLTGAAERALYTPIASFTAMSANENQGEQTAGTTAWSP